MSLRTEVATAAHLAGLDALFAACGSACHCRYWHFEGDKNEWLARLAFAEDDNRRAFHDAIRSQNDEGRGVVALADDVLVGWMKVAPARAVKKLYEQRYYRGLEVLTGRSPDGVCAAGCVLVHPEHRHRGVAKALAHAAIDAARSWDAIAIEAFPRIVSAPVSDEELLAGPLAAYESAGFETVWPHPQYPVLRRPIR